MFDRMMRRIRDRIRRRQYVMTMHAEEEMEADGLTILDIESCLLTGCIIQRQKETGEWKYGVRGETVDGEQIDVVVKLPATGTVVIITTYRS